MKLQTATAKRKQVYNSLTVDGEYMTVSQVAVSKTAVVVCQKHSPDVVTNHSVFI